MSVCIKIELFDFNNIILIKNFFYQIRSKYCSIFDELDKILIFISINF